MMGLWRTYGRSRVTVLIASGCVVAVLGYAAIIHIPRALISYTQPAAVVTAIATTTPEIPVFKVTHVLTPDPVKAVYFTSWAAGSASFRKEIATIVDSTEINSIVVDIKDYSGRISFAVDDPALAAVGASENRISDIKTFIGGLHAKGVYVIGRISSFQDSFLVKVHPEWAVKTKSGAVWKDNKGIMWLDAGAQPVWDYLVAIGKEAYADGFDELNFDYIRYPSDGNMQDIAYSWSNGRPRTEVMQEFFAYLRKHLSDTGVILSADLFGLTTSAQDDMGIGQVLTAALPYFDYVAPMVYPSHFAGGYIGYAHPAQHPYEVIKYSMDSAVQKALASSTPSKLRPWLQAFNLGAIYTPALIREQIQATYDSGLSSWMLWNAASVYNTAALIPKGGQALPQSNPSSTSTAAATK